MQQEGIDYKETFSPMVKFASVHLILAIIAPMDLKLYQMNVKTTFLIEKLDEEIYMNQPLGFELKGQEHKVYKLKISIYSLKQASHCNCGLVVTKKKKKTQLPCLAFDED